jgi:hypothetical protein
MNTREKRRSDSRDRDCDRQPNQQAASKASARLSPSTSRVGWDKLLSATDYPHAGFRAEGDSSLHFPFTFSPSAIVSA